MKILLATSEEFIAPSILNHTSLLWPFATPSDTGQGFQFAYFHDRIFHYFNWLIFIILFS